MRDRRQGGRAIRGGWARGAMEAVTARVRGRGTWTLQGAAGSLEWAMELPVHEGQGFGWSLPLRGRAPEELRRELEGLGRELEGLLGRYFPESAGYRLAPQPAPEDPEHVEHVEHVEHLEHLENQKKTPRPVLGEPEVFAGFALALERGDFRGELAFTCVVPQPGGAAWVRLCGRSGSRSQARERERGLVWAQRLRGVMGGLGALAVLGMLGMLLVEPPHFAVETLFVLGGLFLVVVAVLVVIAAMTLGTWLGGKVAKYLDLRAAAAVAGDDQLSGDLARWEGLRRQVMATRAILVGELRRSPFRHPREAWNQGSDPQASPA